MARAAASVSVGASAVSPAPIRPGHGPVPEEPTGDDWADRPEPADEPTAADGEESRGVGAELRRQLREQKRLRIVALVLVSLVVLGALPLYFGIRSATRDPVFNSLDALGVPGWAAVNTVDDVSGSRWCFIECRFRERTVESERGPDETAQIYQQALSDAGWQPWKVKLCPAQPTETENNGHYTCWRRDELTLDLWVRRPACAENAASQSPGADPSAAASSVPAEDCDGALVSIKVRNAIDDDRTKPQPSTDPSLTGEDPVPILTDDPLADLTPSPS